MTHSEMQIQAMRDQTTCIRLARDGDAVALKRLAELEGRSAPAGNALVADIDGAVLAAIGVTDGETLADPFRHTSGLVNQLIHARAHMLGLSPGRTRRLWSRLRRHGAGGSVPRAAGAPSVPGSESMLIR
jgi:hypothetical protein